MQIEPDLARTLLTLSQTGSVSATAEMLFVTQSAISARLRRLSKVTGGEVVRPSGRGVVLSAHGDAVIAATIDLIAAHDRAVEALTNPAADATLRVLVNEAFFALSLSELAAAVRHQFPHTAIRWTVDGAAHRPDRWPPEQFDLVSHQVLAHETQRSDLVVWDDNLEWVEGLDHHLGADDPVPMVSYGDDCFYRPVMQRALKEAGRVSYDVVTSAGRLGAERAIAVGIGVGVANSRARSPLVKLCPSSARLPSLPPIAQVVRVASGASEAAHQLARFIAAAPPTRRARHYPKA